MRFVNTFSKKNKKIFEKNLKKSVDKYKALCYTIIRKREKHKTKQDERGK
jgi:hypothetical protein